MGKVKLLLLSVLLIGAGYGWAASVEKFELDSVIADFVSYHRGDAVPPLYLTPEYAITQWQLRNLPEPMADTHYTYLGGSYVLISDNSGEIVKIYDGDIFYRH
ncbi:RcnB family protein [Enterobacteriaceae bacterium ESL0689]|nr:RcnB family protein [Enterobacteriaceae bacterium ESL0689]